MLDSLRSARSLTHPRCNATTPEPRPESARSENPARSSGKSHSRILRNSTAAIRANTRQQSQLRSRGARQAAQSEAPSQPEASHLRDLFLITVENQLTRQISTKGSNP